MQQGGIAQGKAMRPGEVPAAVRFLGTLVLEVLPAAMASVIGAFLFAHYQFGAPAHSGPANVTAPASAGMVQLVREEHATIYDFLLAERTAEKARVAAADAADARAAADGKLASIEARRAAVAQTAEKPTSRRGKPKVAAASATGGGTSPTAQLPPVVIASAQQDPRLMPPPQPAPASFVSRTLSVPGRVAAVTLHAVMALGGIPSWIGHRVGATELDTDAPHGSTAS
jgi:hypothetical protein